MYLLTARKSVYLFNKDTEVLTMLGVILDGRKVGGNKTDKISCLIC